MLKVPNVVQVLVFGSAYESIADESCSDTTLRRPRDGWLALWVMDTLRELELSDVAVNGCIPKASNVRLR